MKYTATIEREKTTPEKIEHDRKMGIALIDLADRMGPVDDGVDRTTGRLRTFVEIGIAVLSVLYVVMHRDEADELVSEMAQTARESADMSDASAEVH